VLERFFGLKCDSGNFDRIFLADMYRFGGRLDEAESLYRAAGSEWGLGLTYHLKGLQSTKNP
jgi:hypothetical protein